MVAKWTFAVWFHASISRRARYLFVFFILTDHFLQGMMHGGMQSMSSMAGMQGMSGMQNMNGMNNMMSSYGNNQVNTNTVFFTLKWIYVTQKNQKKIKMIIIQTLSAQL